MTNKFNYLIETLRPTISNWDYFVNWARVFDNVEAVELQLNKLNYLLGKGDFELQFRRLFADSPQVVKVLPLLMAVRSTYLETYDEVLNTCSRTVFDPIAQEPDLYISFLIESGLSQLFQDKAIKNLVDYVKGVEVGLDSNGRKNRGGTRMEQVVASHLEKFCMLRGYGLEKQANATIIYSKWNVVVAVDRTSRRFDFAVFNPAKGRVTVIETNFFNGGGSKLKATCGEYQLLANDLRRQGVSLLWVTDGRGWKTSVNPLQEAFESIPYVCNLQMVADGYLHEVQW